MVCCKIIPQKPMSYSLQRTSAPNPLFSVIHHSELVDTTWSLTVFLGCGGNSCEGGCAGGRGVVDVAQCCECGGVWVWRFPASFCGNDGRGEAVAGRGVLSCICLAPQLVCGCSTRAPLAFFLAWGGWRQRSVWVEAVVLRLREAVLCGVGFLTYPQGVALLAVRLYRCQGWEEGMWGRTWPQHMNRDTHQKDEILNAEA